MNRFDNHEFYAELPFRPEMASQKTSDLKAGHLYYWDGWNSFVINYENCNISPYKVAHIGEIEEASKISELLRKSNEKITVNFKEAE